ncbi:MAG TPA: hypothetical protein VMS17_15765 [Gemmataceae bacterium]|nr:hypothetical protein [Gemmataceae bacterium]
MTSDQAALAVVEALEALGIPYMLVGSFSSNYYGIGRSTKDADFVAEIGAQSIVQVAERLGPQFRLDPQPSFEMVTMTLRYMIYVVDVPFKIELFRLSDDAHDQERFRRRRRVKLLADREVSIPTAEDVIVTKVRWASLARRSKDSDDARAVIAVQGDRIDWDYVNAWCDRLGCRTALDEIRQSIPPM